MDEWEKMRHADICCIWGERWYKFRWCRNYFYGFSKHRVNRMWEAGIHLLVPILSSNYYHNLNFQNSHLQSPTGSLFSDSHCFLWPSSWPQVGLLLFLAASFHHHHRQFWPPLVAYDISMCRRHHELCHGTFACEFRDS